jgi:hypothetical protein
MLQPGQHLLEAGAHRVDVPGGDLHIVGMTGVLVVLAKKLPVWPLCLRPDSAQKPTKPERPHDSANRSTPLARVGLKRNPQVGREASL